ncbi:MAG: hypothetical protein HPY57_15795 [Ignavibacteria bacterium]|nr:hypothetical protein [Ignavibacteria bacterium]
MNKYFELRENGQVLFGVVENIPEKVSIEEIKKRIEASDATKSIEIVDDEFSNVDIVMDWMVIDYEQCFDKEFVYLAEKLDIAIEYGIETEVVFGALKYIKNNPTATITDAIDYSMKTQNK